MSRKVWDQIAYHITKLQQLHHWSLETDKKFHLLSCNGCNYLSMLGLKLNHVSKRVPWCVIFCHLPIPASHPLPVTLWWPCGIASSWAKLQIISHTVCKMFCQGWSLDYHFGEIVMNVIVSWWYHDMEVFSTLLYFVRESIRVLSQRGHWCRALRFYLLSLKARGVLSLLASICLSLFLFVHPDDLVCPHD